MTSIRIPSPEKIKISCHNFELGTKGGGGGARALIKLIVPCHKEEKKRTHRIRNILVPQSQHLRLDGLNYE